MKTGLKQWMGQHNWWFSHYYKKDVYYVYKVLFCFVHVTFIRNQAALGKNPFSIETVAFYFLANCNFNNTFSL